MSELELKCPFCERNFTCGAVAIDGDRYKCIHCNCWFAEVDGKFIKIKYVEIK